MSLLRVATFNIRRGLDAGGHPRDPSALADACRSLGADVLGLQEVDVGSRRSGRVDQAAVAAGGRPHVFGPALRLKRGLDGRYGNALVGPAGGDVPADVAVLRLPGERGDEPRVALLARVAGASVAVTHLSVRREVARAQLDAVLAALLARPAPWVLLGDLNLPTRLVAAPIAGAGLDLADPAAASFPAGAPRARIDHVAVGGGALVERVDVVRTPVSDHRAVVAGVRIPGSGIATGA